MSYFSKRYKYKHLYQIYLLHYILNDRLLKKIYEDCIVFYILAKYIKNLNFENQDCFLQSAEFAYLYSSKLKLKLKDDIEYSFIGRSDFAICTIKMY